jgi:hypothetical protein
MTPPGRKTRPKRLYSRPIGVHVVYCIRSQRQQVIPHSKKGLSKRKTRHKGRVLIRRDKSLHPDFYPEFPSASPHA